MGSTFKTNRGIIADVANTDFLQAVSLFHTRDLRRRAVDDGKQGRDLPQVTASRQALLGLPLHAYLTYQDRVEEGFMQAARFLHRLNIFDAYLRSHLIEPDLLRADDFDGFMADRQRKLLVLIEQATGKQAYRGAAEEGADVADDEDEVEAQLTVAEPLPVQEPA